MTKTIEAIFEDGVFRPLEKLNLKEHGKVEIKISTKDEWQKRFNTIIKNIQKNSTRYTSNEIETDITEAIKDVRKLKRNN